jgi:hypothetical protein
MHNTLETGLNRTGLDMAPLSKDDMVRFAHAAAPSQAQAGGQAFAQARRAFALQADAVGSVPVPMKLRGLTAAAVDALQGHRTAVLIDKLGERLAYERTSVRLYEALEVKARAARIGLQVDPDRISRIRDDEESHFHLLSQCLVTLGADPTAVTPSADLSGVIASGPLQVVSDPRTTMAQAFNAVLLVELGDGAGWDLLVELAQEAGHSDMSQRFTVAQDTERQHLERVRTWLREAVLAEAT